MEKNILIENYERMFGKGSLIKEESWGQYLNKIIKMPYTEFIKKIKNISQEPKVQNILNAGKIDGKPIDEKIQMSELTLRVKDLIPTQSEIGVKESLQNILDDKYKSTEAYLKGSYSFPTPLITLNSKYVIDGHHRWSQTYCANPNAMVNVYDMEININPIKALKIVQLAIAASIGTLPSGKRAGANLITISENDVKEYVINNLKPEVLELYIKYKKGNTNEEVANYIWKNVYMMQQNNAPVSKTIPRIAMPQTDDAINWDDKLQKGLINFIKPQVPSIK